MKCPAKIMFSPSFESSGSASYIPLHYDEFRNCRSFISLQEKNLVEAVLSFASKSNESIRNRIVKVSILYGTLGSRSSEKTYIEHFTIVSLYYSINKSNGNSI